MKRYLGIAFFGLLFAAVVLYVHISGKAEQPVSSKAVGAEQAIKVDKLFTHEGCAVYRFFDANAYRYFRNCTGTVGDGE